jgi:hypothetical protein
MRFRHDVDHEERWRRLLTGQTVLYRRARRLFGLIPARDRCKNCNAPFTGLGRVLMLLMGRRRYRRNPRFCNY